MAQIVQSAWQRRRSEFNHQWLKNRLLSALDSAANILDGRIRGDGYLEDILQREAREWPERAKELDRLLGDFESEMSPQQLFCVPPLCNWDTELKLAMTESVHQLWLARFSVQELIAATHLAACRVSNAHEQMAEIPAFRADGQVDAAFVSRFEAFRAACRELSELVGKFPNKVQVA